MSPIEIIGLIWLFLRKQGGSSQASAAPLASALSATPSASSAVVTTEAKHVPSVANRAAVQPEPWPATPPNSLPKFPGRGWEPDVPVRPEVAARALQLIRPLHKRGLGSSVIEHTQGRWIAYAAKMHGTKKAVEAFRVKPFHTEPPSPVPVANASHTVAPSGAVAVSPVQAPSPPPNYGQPWAEKKPVTFASVFPPTIRRGSRGPDVNHAQILLKVEPTDGIFGPITEKAVIQYQTHHDLDIDGIIGPKTWASLLGASA